MSDHKRRLRRLEDAGGGGDTVSLPYLILEQEIGDSDLYHAGDDDTGRYLIRLEDQFFNRIVYLSTRGVISLPSLSPPGSMTLQIL
jgi:hypothetical protein